MSANWTMHIEPLRPLAEAGKLGCLLFQFPPWFRKNRASVDYLRGFAIVSHGRSPSSSVAAAGWRRIGRAVMNNCYRDYVVRNARQLAALLAQPRADCAPAMPPAASQSSRPDRGAG
jgi:uncharacterized protein YecE (DUF72 family)